LEENWRTQRKTLVKRENQQKTQLAYDAKSGDQTRVTVVRGMCSHRYATHASHIHVISYKVASQSFSDELVMCVKDIVNLPWPMSSGNPFSSLNPTNSKNAES
jgi:hypothetical protein